MRLIIEFDARNSIARDFLELMRKMKIFKIRMEDELTKEEINCINASIRSKKNALDEAIDDVKKGNITTCKDFEDYKKVTRKILEDV